MSRVHDRVILCWSCMAHVEVSTDWTRGGKLVEVAHPCTCKAAEAEIGKPQLTRKCQECGAPCRTKFCLSCSSANQKKRVYPSRAPKVRVCEDCGGPLAHQNAKRCLPCGRAANLEQTKAAQRAYRAKKRAA